MTANLTHEEPDKKVRGADKKLTEQRPAREESNTLRAALNTGASGVIITDKKGRIKYSNPAFLRMFDYGSTKDVTGKYAAELFSSQGGRRFVDIGAIIDRSKGETEEFQGTRKDGTTFHVEVSTSGITDGLGHDMGKMACFVDITDRKQMEKALKESSEKIKFFAYSISHDLKSPAVGLYGLTKRLYKDYADILGEKGQRYCEQILKTSEQIAALVEQINVFISTKEAPLTIERLALKDVLQVIREEFASQLSIREIRWSDPDYIPDIEADRLCLIRAFRNLEQNAIKYGGDALSEIDIKYEGSGQFHILSVRDNGIGLKAQDSHEDIFAPFIRSKTSKGIQGSGLELAIIREIAQKHGGDVWLEPVRERGITFYISIPKSLHL
ncbi:MAG: PAS domain-containing sensor histidine kinase [Desulfatiglans sp.]|jgi:PAS domain S-box-containing protein|nr:PAS domain-containing sensor histidine kinase [Desulfatiglans sp.]